MNQLFPLAPRYRLDDESPWLKGIDPSRHYWININGEERLTVALPGLIVSSAQEFKQAILKWLKGSVVKVISLLRLLW